MRNDLPQLHTVTDRVEHGPTAVSLTLDFLCEFTPGQFIMAWLPGIDEKPFSISRHRADSCEITVKRLGPVSNQIADLTPGGRLGIRGPYGHGFTPIENCCFVAGGVGLAAVAPLIERFPSAPVLYGENTATHRLFAGRFPSLRFFTMDGSAGEKGFPTDALPETLASRRPQVVYTCGPEVMMAKVVRICLDAGVASQISLERYMKCAMGVCGQCCMDGQRVCVDGPVFDGALLAAATDFGFRQMDKSGTWRAVGAARLTTKVSA